MTSDTISELYRRLREYVNGTQDSMYTAEEHASRLRSDARFWRMMGADKRAAECESEADRYLRERHRGE